MPVVNLDESCVLHRWHVPTASPLFLSWMPGWWEMWWLFLDETKTCQPPIVSERNLQLPERRNNKNTNEFCAVACDRCDLGKGTSFRLRLPKKSSGASQLHPLFGKELSTSEIPPLFEEPSLSREVQPRIGSLHS